MAAENTAGIWGGDAAQALEALDYSASALDLAAALAGRRSALAEKETALQRWAVALECESARQASELRALQAQAEQASTSHAHAEQAVSCLLAAWLDDRWHAIHHHLVSCQRPSHMHLIGLQAKRTMPCTGCKEQPPGGAG